MEYQNGQPLPGRAPAGAHGPARERISRPHGTVPLTGGDTDELQGNFHSDGGYFLAGQSSFWRAKIG